MSTFMQYDREKALEYSNKWALKRNPKYFDYNDIGGDCTNFASQTLYAGSGVMNYTPTKGWYYHNANDKSASWTAVEYLYLFLMRKNTQAGPIAQLTTVAHMQPGDIIQLKSDNRYSHTLIVVSVTGRIFINAHTYDSYFTPLSGYQRKDIRYLHIEGVYA